MREQYLEVGKITAVQGLRGEVRVQHYCDSADVFCDFERLFLARGSEEIGIERAYPRKNTIIVKIKGVDSPEQAQKLVGKSLYMDREDEELPDGVYYINDIIGLEVKDTETGEIYGKVTDVYQNGASDVYSIKKENGKELMFPVIDEVVRKIDIERGEILIKPLEGLFDED